MSGSRSFDKDILPHLVRYALNGSEPAVAAILYGLLDVCHIPPRLPPLEVLHDHNLTALKPDVMSDYDGQKLYKRIFSWESTHLLGLVLTDYAHQHGCQSDEEMKCAQCEQQCEVPGVALWRIFKPILELQDPRLDADREEKLKQWLHSHQVEANASSLPVQDRVLAVIQLQLSDLLRNLKKFSLYAEEAIYERISKAFEYLQSLIDHALNPEPSAPFFPKRLPEEDVFTEEVRDELRQLAEIADMNWDRLTPLSGKIRSKWPLPAYVVFDRILRIKFKERF